MSDLNEIHLTDTAIDKMLSECRVRGVEVVETGGYLLVERGKPTVTEVAISGSKGVLRHPRLYDVSGAANEELQDWAFERGLIIAAQWHTHRFGAYMSDTDLTSGINIPGMITAIIPEFENPPTDHRAWGWWMFEEGEWRDVAPPTLVPGDTQAVVFDEDGCVRND